jgi:hypothetical protein
MAYTGRAQSFKWDTSTGLVAIVAAVLCLIPTIGFLMAWHMQVDLRSFTLFATLPALIALGACELFLVRKSPLLFNRFATGLVGGLAATLALDIIRLPATLLFKGAPDWVPMIGQHLVGDMIGIAPTTEAIALGYGYHYLLIGALQGAAYSLILRRGRMHWGTLVGAVAGLIMIALPQARMLIVATGFDLVTASAIWLVAYTVAGTVLGAVVQRLGRTVTNAFYVVFMREELVETPELALAGERRA